VGELVVYGVLAVGVLALVAAVLVVIGAGLSVLAHMAIVVVKDINEGGFGNG